MSARVMGAALAALFAAAATAEVRFQRTPEQVDRASFLTDAFAVTAGGEQRDVRACVVGGAPSAYLELEANEPVAFTVKPKTPGAGAKILPSARAVPVTAGADGTLSFTLPYEGAFVLAFDDGRTLQIFYDRIENYEEAAIAAKYSFGPGVHDVGTIYPRENESVYVDRDAVVYGSIQVRGAGSVQVFGHGVIDSTRLPEWLGSGEDPRQPRPFAAFRANGSSLRDVLLIGSHQAVVAMYDCNDFELAGCKVLSARPGGDAVDVVCSNNGSIRTTYLRAPGCAVSLRGTLSMRNRHCSNNKVSGCFLWSDGGRALAVGPETWSGWMDSTLFDDCDIICRTASALDVCHGGNGSLRTVTANDLRVEFTRQRDDAQCHLVRCTNLVRPMRPGWEWDWKDGWNLGRIDAFTVRSLHLRTPEGVKLPDVEISAHTNSGGFGQITLRDFTLNGNRVNPLEAFNAVTNGPCTKRLRVR